MSMLQKVVLLLFVALLLFLTSDYFVLSSQKQKVKTIAEPTPTLFIPSPTPIELNADILWSLINEHRQKLGLKSFIKNQELCGISEKRVDELTTDYSHDKFLDRFANYPYTISENIVTGSNEQLALNGWLSSTPHRKAIEGDWVYSCVSTNNVYAEEVFSSFDKINHNAL